MNPVPSVIIGIHLTLAQVTSCGIAQVEVVELEAASKLGA
jgi:hypothetical protein